MALRSFFLCDYMLADSQVGSGLYALSFYVELYQGERGMCLEVEQDNYILKFFLNKITSCIRLMDKENGYGLKELGHSTYDVDRLHHKNIDLF